MALRPLRQAQGCPILLFFLFFPSVFIRVLFLCAALRLPSRPLRKPSSSSNSLFGPRFGNYFGSQYKAKRSAFDECKAVMAALIRWRPAVITEWIAKRLQMGHSDLVSRQMGIVKRDRKLLK